MNSAKEITGILAHYRPQLVTRYPIRRLAMFGSHARNEATPGSDVDILVEFSEPVGLQFFELARELEQILQKPVDLVSRYGIKPACYSAIEPDLIDV